MSHEFIEGYLGFNHDQKGVYSALKTEALRNPSLSVFANCATITEPHVITPEEKQIYVLADGVCAVRKSMDTAPFYFVQKPGMAMGVEWLAQDQEVEDCQILDPVTPSCNFHIIPHEFIHELMSQESHSGEQRRIFKQVFQLLLGSVHDISGSVMSNHQMRVHRGYYSDLTLALLHSARNQQDMVRITHERIGNLTGAVDRSLIKKIMRNFQKEGLIDQSYRKVLLKFDELPED